MRLAFLLLATALLQGVFSEDYYDDLPSDLVDPVNNDTINEADVDAHLKIQETLQHFHHCRDKEWPCSRHCRLEFRARTNQCRDPNPSDKCFGVPITYKYTRDSPIEGRFPSELEALSRYPRCWSHLAPLICATIFRPCSHNYFIEKDRNGSVKNGTIELWQLLGSSTCETTRRMCSDIVLAGLFPSFIHCKNDSNNTRDNRTIYSSKCQHIMDELPVKTGSGSCPWPLVSTSASSNSIDAVPLLDSCSLPCRSPLVPSSLSDRYRYLRFTICSVLAALFFLESIYLSRFCEKFNESLPLFYISHAVISMASYCFIWSLSLFDIFFNLSECSVDGISRRDAASHSLFEWCSLQSILLYASFLAAFTWLVLQYINTICPSSFFATYFPRPFVKSSRPVLILCVYGMSVIISFLARSLRENDGDSGVCFPGVFSWRKYLLSILPLFCLSLALFCIGALFIFRRKAFLKSVAFKQALSTLDKAEEQRNRGSFADIKLADIESLDNLKNCEYVADEVSKQISEVHKRENLLQESSRHILGNEFIRTYHSLSKRLQRDRNSGVSLKWTGASFVCFVLFIVGSPIVHFCYVGVSPKFEAASIVDYVNCRIANSVRNRSFEWTSQSNYPAPSDEAPWCRLPFEKSRKRLEGVFIVFIILPVLPFLVFLLAFFASINGYKGIGNVLGVRGYVGVSSKAALDEHALTDLGISKNAVSADLESIEAVFPASLNSVKANGLDVVNDTSADHHAEVYKTIVNEVDRMADSDRASQKEYEEEFSSIMNQLRGNLSFQQGMLVNDGAAWNISLYYLQRIEQLLRAPPTPVDACAQDLRLLGQEITRVLPSVSEHAMQLTRWMSSVQEMCLKIEHVQRTVDEDSSFGSQDILRQQHLLALNECLIRNLAADVSQHVSRSVNEAVPANELVSEQACSRSEAKENSSKQQPSSIASEISEGDVMQERESQCNHEPGPSRSRANVSEVSEVASGRQNVSGNVDVQQRQSGGPNPVLRISAYAESYCATPHGILTKLTIPELRIRVQQIKNICAGDSLYPQELSYMLLVTGDVIFGGNRDSEGYHIYSMEQLPSIFGTNPPTIDARVGVQEFLAHMRRRALCVVAAVGYHFSLHDRRGPEYTPPVLPPLGLYRSENELVLRRVLGDTNDVLPSLRDFLQEFQFGRGPVVPRPDLKFASAFRNYLRLVAAREGFSSDFEEYVPDPLPPVEPVDMSHSSEESDFSNDSGEDDGPLEPN